MGAMSAPGADGRPAPHSVVLVDDMALFRQAIASLLEAEPDFTVAGQAGNGLEGVELVAETRPDLVLMDVEMPVMDGVRAARLVRERSPGSRIVMLTVAEDDEHLLGALRDGVHGYLLKDMRPDELFTQLRAVARGETPVDPALVGRLVAELRDGTPRPRPAAAPAPEDALSHRELEILRLVAQGLSNKEIGQRVSITEGTVKNHVHNSLRKLGMENRIQAAAYIVRQGLGTPSTRR